MDAKFNFEPNVETIILFPEGITDLMEPNVVLIHQFISCCHF